MLSKQSRARFWLTPAHLASQGDWNEPLPAMRMKWSWVCRAFDPRQRHWLIQEPTSTPQPGDVVLTRVKSMGLVHTVVTAGGEQVRLYPGDGLIGIFGDRGMLACYEADVTGVTDLHLIRKNGLIGTIHPAYRPLLYPTQLTFLGYLADSQGQRLNLKQRLWQPKLPVPVPCPLLFVVGAGLDSGKDQVIVDLVEGLGAQGLRVAAYRLLGGNGSPQSRTLWMTFADYVGDYSAHEFLTGGGHEEQWNALVAAMLTDATQTQPDLIIVELGDHLLELVHQRLFALPIIQQQGSGIVLTAANHPPSAQTMATLHAFAASMTACRLLAIVGGERVATLAASEGVERNRPDWISLAGADKQLASLVRERLCLTMTHKKDAYL